MKRTQHDASTPLKDRTNVKKAKTEEPVVTDLDLPEPRELPDDDDDGTKPTHSYATLIGMAILRSENRRLTLAQIYKWISEHYRFYRASEAGWQNSIRHNLSLNKNFVKQERPKDDPGKGNYWAIRPGQENLFLKDRPIRRVPGNENFAFTQGSTMHDFSTGGRPSSAPAIGHFTLEPSANKSSEPRGTDPSRFPADHASSDGTIPGSDPALGDELGDSLAMPPPASRRVRSMTPADDINSSPPPMASDSMLHATPSTLPKLSLASADHDRKYANVNDSGYYSSIESSAMRPQIYAHSIVTSEADHDRSRAKRGRAEEAIARIRSSSFDSPSKDLGVRKKAAAQACVASPDCNAEGQAESRIPITPSVIFKKPAVPAPAISPNTNLRNHRERMQKLLGETPNRADMTPLKDSWHTWSPHFSMADPDDTVSNSPSKLKSLTPWRDADFGTAFGTYGAIDDLAARGSPGKKAGRPGLARAVTSIGILADITGANSFSVAPTADMTEAIDSPFNTGLQQNKMPSNQAPQRQASAGHSPVKRSQAVGLGMQTNHSEFPGEWLDLSMENFFGTSDLGRVPLRNDAQLQVPSDAAQFTQPVLPVDVNVMGSDGSSEEGLDILQGFGKIGANVGVSLQQHAHAQHQQQMQMQHQHQQSQQQQRYAFSVASAAQVQAQTHVQGNILGSPIKRGSLVPARPSMARSVTSRF